MAGFFKVNEAVWDRVARVLGGVLLMALGWGGMAAGGWDLVFKIIGILLVVTGLVGYCPLYTLLKISTRPRQKT